MAGTERGADDSPVGWSARRPDTDELVERLAGILPEADGDATDATVVLSGVVAGVLESPTETVLPVETVRVETVPVRPRARHRRRFAAVPAPRRALPLTLYMALVLLAVGVTAHQAAVTGADAAGPSLTIRSTGPLNLAKPFAGTPAADWADGGDGILPPTPTPVGTHTAEQVAAALAATKKLLVAGHLDPVMLVTHDPGTYVALLAPDARPDELAQIAGTSGPDEGGEVTLLAPGYHLLSAAPKVSGSMSVGTDSNGQLVVHANYVYAYPFAPADPRKVSRPWQIVAVQHAQEDVTVVSGSEYPSGDRGLWVTSTKSYYESMACAAARHGLLAPAYSDPRTTSASQDPNMFFDPNHALNVGSTCPP